jgi:hypothetical protein
VSIFICWVLFPLLFCLLALGCGLLIRRIAGVPVRGVLLLPLGYATIVVASQVTTFFKATTVLATPLVVVLAVAGLLLGARDLRPTTGDLWPAAAALGVFCVYAAPVVLSGSATFLGYTLLGDTSIHFTLIDWVMAHGFHSLPSGPASSTHSALHSYLATAYPLGAHTALGAVRPLVGQDVAWVFQPYLSLLAVFTSLSIYAILEGAIPQRWLLALAAFVAAQSGLVYAYALEGSIKELGTVCAIAILVAVGADYVRVRGGLRAVLPLATVTAASFGILNASILPWLGPILVAVLVGLLGRRGFYTWRAAALEAGVFAAVAAVLAFPSLAKEGTFIHATTATLTSSSTAFGNLLGPLSTWHAFGIWPTGDFRLPLVSHVAGTYALIGLELLAILIGLLWALRQRSGWPLVFAGASVIGWAYVTARSNAWGDAKALMIVSPAVIAVAMLGPASLWQAARRPEAVLTAAALAFGVLWTNAIAYHDADLAPRDRLQELGRIGDRFAGQGPTLYTEFEEFGKHFLHQEDPTGSNDSWQDPPLAKSPAGTLTRFGFSSSIDGLALDYVERFRTLVLRRSGSASRPPSDYRLAYSGGYYDVWQKTAGHVVAHLSLGNALDPAAVPKCSQVKALTGDGGDRLAYVERPPLPVLLPSQTQHPPYWHPDGADPTNVRAVGAGTLSGAIDVTQPGRYVIWVQGSFDRGFTVVVDGRRVGTLRDQLNPRGQFASAGAVTLAPGRHAIALVRGAGDLRPGDGGRNRLLGPIVLDPASDTPVVRQVPLSRWRDLCGKRLDWVEAIR